MIRSGLFFLMILLSFGEAFGQGVRVPIRPPTFRRMVVIRPANGRALLQPGEATPHMYLGQRHTTIGPAPGQGTVKLPPVPPLPRTTVSPVTGAAARSAGATLQRLCEGSGCTAKGQVRLQTLEAKSGTISRAQVSCPGCGAFTGSTAQQRSDMGGKIGVTTTGHTGYGKALPNKSTYFRHHSGPALTPGARKWGTRAGIKMLQQPGRGAIDVTRDIFLPKGRK